ncbi:MAG: hypothetical protein ACTSX7_07825, partial [Alphaproteobacteria bacterium]
FPHRRSLDENGPAGLEEERRLAYVGLTRAKRHAEILFAANRRIHGQWQSAMPSRFIDELPAEHVTVESESGLYSNTSPSFGRHDRVGGATNTQRENSGFGSRRARFRRPPAVIEGHAERVGDGRTSSFAVGERVFHQKFGYGLIKTVEGNKLEIAFEKAGTKKVMDSFILPASAV